MQTLDAAGSRVNNTGENGTVKGHLHCTGTAKLNPHHVKFQIFSLIQFPKQDNTGLGGGRGGGW